MAVDLNAFAVFAAVAEARNFRAAADRLGVTRSAVSQTIQRLEQSLGTALFRRTTRSVSLTEDGEHLLRRVGPALGELDVAIAIAMDRETRPAGLLRIAVSSIAERFIDGTLVTMFMERHPDVQLDVTVTDEEFDIVSRGFDAGVRLGEVLEQDMIAVPLAGDQRQIVVGAPDYLKRFGTPEHPRDLARHRCIGWRPAPDVPPYRWEFSDDGRDIAVDVAPQVTSNDMSLMLRTARAGGGLTFGMADTFRPYLDRGELVAMLEAYCPPFAGFYLYYPDRRYVAPKLRALINLVHEQAGHASLVPA